MPGNFAPNFIANLAQAMREDLRGGMSNPLRLFFLFSFDAHFLNFLDLHLNDPQGIQNSLPIFKIIVPILGGEFSPTQFS